MLTVDFDRLQLRPGDKLLDMGCGGGRHAFAAMKRGASVLALDYSEADLKDVRATVGAMREAGEIPATLPWMTVNGDALRLPFPDASIDRIVCSEVLEHIWDYRGAITELVRVLKPGGRMAVTIPTRWPERVNWALDHEYHDAPGAHVRIFRQHELEQDLEGAGLWLRGSHHAHALHSPYWWIRCMGGVNQPDRRGGEALPRLPRLAAHEESEVAGGRRPGTEPGHGQEPRHLHAEGGPVTVAGVFEQDALLATVDAIASVQLPDGNIPWTPGGHTDPWNLVEAALALDVGGRHAEAARAYEWLRAMQNPDGSWHAYYVGNDVKDPTLDTNVACYLATGVWHHYLCTGDTAFLRDFWPTVERTIDYALGYQTETGEIAWRADDPADGALLTGSSSIHHSLRCAIAIAERLGHDRPDWELSVGALAIAIAHRPERFLDKGRWAMDWYYPILGGVLRGQAAQMRIAAFWDTFVVPGRGVRCVSDQPWVTAAETCELVMALDAIGETERAHQLFRWVQFLRHDDGRTGAA